MLDEPVEVGDYVLNHVGFALRRIPPGEVAPMLALFGRLIELADADDPASSDPPPWHPAG
jgi:hydrogenase expression/formation protein HypC